MASDISVFEPFNKRDQALDTIRLVACAGSQIDACIEAAIELANAQNKSVVFAFNGIDVFVSPSDNVDNVKQCVEAERTKKQREWEESPEGIAHKEEQERKHQAAFHVTKYIVQKLLGIVPVPANNAELMAVLAYYVVVADHTGSQASLYKDDIIAHLEEFGFKAGDLVGDEAFSDGTATREMSLRWVVGQCMDTMNVSGGAPHPGLLPWVLDFADKDAHEALAKEIYALEAECDTTLIR